MQACEAAAASISRPGTPISQPGSSFAPEKELQVKLKLEGLIDKVPQTKYIQEFASLILTYYPNRTEIIT